MLNPYNLYSMIDNRWTYFFEGYSKAKTIVTTPGEILIFISSEHISCNGYDVTFYSTKRGIITDCGYESKHFKEFVEIKKEDK